MRIEYRITAWLGILCAGCASPGSAENRWTLLAPRSWEELQAVHIADPDHVYLAGVWGTQMKLLRGGTEWVAQGGRKGYHLTYLRFFDPYHGVAMGTNGTLHRTRDGGTRWDSLPGAPDASVYSAQFLDAQVGFVSGFNGQIHKTTDGGLTWQAQSTGTDRTLNRIRFATPDVGFAFYAGDTALLATVDGGKRWTPRNAGDSLRLYDIAFPHPDTAFAVGQRGDEEGRRILRSSDKGVSWTSVLTHPFKLGSIQFLDGRFGYAFGYDGGFCRTLDGGRTWISARLDGRRQVVAMHFHDANLGYAVGGFGTIQKSEDGGLTWKLQFVPPPGRINAVHFVDGDTGFAVMRTEGVGQGAATFDGGVSWVTGGLAGESDVFMLDSKTGYSVGDNGFNKTTSGIHGWRHLTAGSAISPPNGVDFPSRDTGYITHYGGVSKTVDGGATWNATPVFGQGYAALHFLDTETGHAVGGTIDRGYIARTRDGGKTWAVQFTETGNVLWGAVHFPNRQVGYLAGSGGRLAKTTDGGETWQPQVAGTDRFLHSIFFLDADKGFAAGQAGTLLATEDGGATWNIQAVPTRSDLTDVHCPNLDVCYVVGDESTLLKLRRNEPAAIRFADRAAKSIRVGTDGRPTYFLVRPGRVRARLHRLDGRAVAVLQDGVQAAGTHALSLPSGGRGEGVRLLVLEIEGERTVRRIPSIP